LRPELEFTDTWQPQLSDNETDMRERLSPKREPGAEFHFPYYSQVFEDRHGFLKNMSILDLLFCTGPQAGNVLKAGSV
jgi:hypothetical protein